MSLFNYFGTSEDQKGGEFVLTQLTELKSFLDNNRAAQFTTIDETWIFTDTGTNNQLKVEINKDVNEKFVWGDYWGLNGCGFISCGGWVEEITVSGTSVTIEVGYPQGSAIFNGTFTDETHIEGTYTEYDDFGVETDSGTFTATRQSRERETINVDFNRIFGSATKSQLDIRAILPEFDQYGEPIAGTFPPTDDSSPVLNGILPDIQTNDDLTRELELQPTGFFNIPTVNNISIDGNSSDWPTSALAFTDVAGDENENTDFAGMDIHELYLAKDSAYLYIGMELYDGDPNTTNPGAGYVFQANATAKVADTPGDLLASVWYQDESWISCVSKREYFWEPPTLINYYTPDYAAAGNNFIEWKVPLNEMGNLSGKFIRAYSHVTGGVFPPVYPVSDENITRIMLDTASVSGSITCTANGTGNIFVGAYDGPDWRYAHRLGGAVADADGNYNIEGLPVGASFYLFARWDADDNGIKTLGDYVGMTGPITVVSGGVTDAGFSVNTPIDDSFIMTKPGVYRVFGSNAYDVPQYYYGPGDPNEIAWNRSEWTFIGESNKTETFNTGQYYETILMIWHEDSSFNFDAIEDLTAGTAFATNANGTSCGYSWITSGLKNSDADQWTEPFYFNGHPDGLYANTAEWYGFNLFTMPDDSIADSIPRQLKITLVSNVKGDVDGNTNVNLADAILALKVAAGLSPGGVNLNADVNGDGKIGLAEVVYILQNVAGLR